MPKFDYYISYLFEDCDKADKLIRQLHLLDYTCFNDTYLTQDVYSSAITKTVLDYCDYAIFYLGDDENKNLMLAPVAEDVMNIGLEIIAVRQNNYSLSNLFGNYDRITCFDLDENCDEKCIANKIISSRNDDEVTIMMRKFSFTDDNTSSQVEFAIKKLWKICSLLKHDPVYTDMLYKGISESAKLDWNKVNKEGLQSWLEVIKFASQHLPSGNESKKEALEVLCAKVAKALQ